MYYEHQLIPCSLVSLGWSKSSIIRILLYWWQQYACYKNITIISVLDVIKKAISSSHFSISYQVSYFYKVELQLIILFEVYIFSKKFYKPS